MYRDREHRDQMRAAGAIIDRPQVTPETKRLDAKSKAREAAAKLLGKSTAINMATRPRGM